MCVEGLTGKYGCRVIELLIRNLQAVHVRIKFSLIYLFPWTACNVCTKPLL